MSWSGVCNTGKLFWRRRLLVDWRKNSPYLQVISCMKRKNQMILVKGHQIETFTIGDQDFISLTDIARNKNPDEPKDVVKNWIRNRSTLEFIGLWEKLNNPKFKGVEFDSFLFDSGQHSFTLSPSRWIDQTNAIGIVSKKGHNGGTFAHVDIAFEFASWISSEFKLYLIKEFQRLKKEETKSSKIEWKVQRILSKINYQILTDTIKIKLIPKELNINQINFIYADEADLLNVALFGISAKEWRLQNPDLAGNIRDYSSLEQLVVLSNLESINSIFITQNISQKERLIRLHDIAASQLKSILFNPNLKKLQ
jgi:hypothetical protein